MKYKVKVTVIDIKLYPELQHQYCADPNSGACPCYNIGDEFVFYRDGEKDDFWHMGLNTLVKTDADPSTVAGGPRLPFCSEARLLLRVEYGFKEASSKNGKFRFVETCRFWQTRTL